MALKRAGAVAVLLATSVLPACGGGSDSPDPTQSRPMPPESRAMKPAQARSRPSSPKPKLKMSKAEIAKLPKIRIGQRNGPRPKKKLVVRDLRKGSGAVVKPDDKILVRFFSVKYAEARKGARTGRFGPTEFALDGGVIKGWEEGLPGMRVGGRRELIVPPKLGYRGWTLIYVVDVLAVHR